MSDQIVSITKPGPRPVTRQESMKQESTFPTEVINLPSKGWFYPDTSPLSTGTIELKVMTAKEEDILTSKNLMSKGIVLDKVLESLVIEKAINPADMLNCDRDAVFLAIRRMAYGDEYQCKMACPRCQHENDLTIDLSKMDNKPFDFSPYTKGKNEFDFVLPVSKKTVTYKLLSKRDEDAIDADIKSLQKISKGETSSEVTTRLRYALIAVDGNPDKSAIWKFSQEIRSKDSLELRKYSRAHAPGVDMAFDFKCSECGCERREDVPMTISFFWPNS